MTSADCSIPRRLFLILLVAVIVGLLAIACGDGGDDGAATPAGDGAPVPQVTVVTTLPVFADFVREAGGDRVEVFVVLPDGVDPDLQELPPEDIERINRADLVLYNGLDLETRKSYGKSKKINH